MCFACYVSYAVKYFPKFVAKEREREREIYVKKLFDAICDSLRLDCLGLFTFDILRRNERSCCSNDCKDTKHFCDKYIPILDVIFNRFKTNFRSFFL